VRGVASSAAFRFNHQKDRLVKEVTHWTQGLLSPWRERQVAMFHLGRSGSSVLARCLNQHPQICWGGIFKRYENDPYDPLDVLETERLRAGRRYFGFEVKPYHLHKTSHSLAGHIEALRHHGVEHFVLLRRKNLLRKLVSSMIADKHTYHLSKDEKRVQVHVDTNKVEAHWQDRSLLRQINKHVDEYETVRRDIEGGHALHLTYEDDIYESPLRAYRRVVDFLG
jgi:hypothetical protein